MRVGDAWYTDLEVVSCCSKQVLPERHSREFNASRDPLYENPILKSEGVVPCMMLILLPRWQILRDLDYADVEEHFQPKGMNSRRQSCLRYFRCPQFKASLVGLTIFPNNN